ncbi:septal ring lytic transglycosylase RlpA family protein [Erythrobacter neustonensis]|uniref:septal ring lytic transglycosylase RlpA family protein n=1 Tax=Erythrobacter neustonensis TaxID=1112 RepID=UPI0009EDC3A9|nr:septal ring lytic transglycosylase RlpA family protein [Erythrobacter neustonensis]
MRNQDRTPGNQTRKTAHRNIAALLVAGAFGVAPLAASFAAAPEQGPQVQPVASAAAVEMVPLTTVAELPAPVAQTAEAAPSAPRESIVGRGSASYYAAHFNGRRTASGERFDNADLTAAHRTLPFGSRVRVTNVANGRSVVVRINDRGPFTRGRMIDVSRAAADQLGLVARGHGDVELALIAG